MTNMCGLPIIPMEEEDSEMTAEDLAHVEEEEEEDSPKIWSWNRSLVPFNGILKTAKKARVRSAALLVSRSRRKVHFNLNPEQLRRDEADIPYRQDYARDEEERRKKKQPKIEDAKYHKDYAEDYTPENFKDLLLTLRVSSLIIDGKFKETDDILVNRTKRFLDKYQDLEDRQNVDHGPEMYLDKWNMLRRWKLVKISHGLDSERAFENGLVS